MPELHNNDALWAYAMRASEEFRMMDQQRLNDETLYRLISMGIFNWRGDDKLLFQAQQAVRWSCATSTRCVEAEFPSGVNSDFYLLGC